MQQLDGQTESHQLVLIFRLGSPRFIGRRLQSRGTAGGIGPLPWPLRDGIVAVVKKRRDHHKKRLEIEFSTITKS